MVWVVVVLIRGATDGWVPYPFFNPATGYGLVFTNVLAIAVLTVVTTAIAWALNRLKLMKLRFRNTECLLAQSTAPDSARKSITPSVDGA